MSLSFSIIMQETRTKTTRMRTMMRTTTRYCCYRLCFFVVLAALCNIATLRPVVGDEYDHKVIV